MGISFTAIANCGGPSANQFQVEHLFFVQPPGHPNSSTTLMTIFLTNASLEKVPKLKILNDLWPKKGLNDQQTELQILLPNLGFGKSIMMSGK